MLLEIEYYNIILIRKILMGGIAHQKNHFNNVFLLYY